MTWSEWMQMNKWSVVGAKENITVNKMTGSVMWGGNRFLSLHLVSSFFILFLSLFSFFFLIYIYIYIYIKFCLVILLGLCWTTLPLLNHVQLFCSGLVSGTHYGTLKHGWHRFFGMVTWVSRFMVWLV